MARANPSRIGTQLPFEPDVTPEVTKEPEVAPVAPTVDAKPEPKVSKTIHGSVRVDN